MSVQHNGDGQYGVFIPDDGGSDAANAHGDAVAGDSLAPDDLIGAVPDLTVEPVHIRPAEGLAANAAEIFQCQTGDIGLAPNCKFAVPVFTDDESVDVPAVHPQLLAQQLLEPPGVQHGAGADDPLSGIA